MTSEQAPASGEQDAHDRLGAALRGLADVVVRTGADADEIVVAAARIEAITARLAAAPVRRYAHDTPYHPRSMVGGTAHPAAAQLHTVPTEDGVAGTVVLGPAYEGGPGLVHGGVVSLLFDHAMGQALFVAGHRAMTVSLEVRYRTPTPLEVPLVVSARLERREGRKLFVSGQLSADGQATAEASGLFLELTDDNVAQIFAADRLPHRR